MITSWALLDRGVYATMQTCTIWDYGWLLKQWNFFAGIYTYMYIENANILLFSWNSLSLYNAHLDAKMVY